MTIEEAAEGLADEWTGCKHHYILDHGGASSPGQCKHCGHRRGFQPFLPDNMGDYARPMAVKAEKDWQARMQGAKQAYRMGYTDWSN